MTDSLSMAWATARRRFSSLKMESPFMENCSQVTVEETVVPNWRDSLFDRRV